MNNLTPHAQRVLTLARKEAERLGHNYIGNEHVLLAMLSLDLGIGVAAIKQSGLELETVKKAIEMAVGSGQSAVHAVMPYTPRLKKVFSLAGKEARAFNDSFTDTEHFLLGIMKEGESMAARVLADLGLKYENLRAKILLLRFAAIEAEDLGPNPDFEALFRRERALRLAAEKRALDTQSKLQLLEATVLEISAQISSAIRST